MTEEHEKMGIEMSDQGQITEERRNIRTFNRNLRYQWEFYYKVK